MNPTGNNSATPKGNGLASIINPKSVHIQKAQNGFVLQLQKVDEYGQDYSIAASIEDIGEIIKTYFA